MNYAQQNTGGVESAEQTMVDKIQRRIDGLRESVAQLHALADRACGGMPPAPSEQKPSAVPNGMFEQIIVTLADLENSAQEAVRRLSTIA